MLRYTVGTPLKCRSQSALLPFNVLWYTQGWVGVKQRIVLRYVAGTWVTKQHYAHAPVLMRTGVGGCQAAHCATVHGRDGAHKPALLSCCRFRGGGASGRRDRSASGHAQIFLRTHLQRTHTKRLMSGIIHVGPSPGSLPAHDSLPHMTSCQIWHAVTHLGKAAYRAAPRAHPGADVTQPWSCNLKVVDHQRYS